MEGVFTPTPSYRGGAIMATPVVTFLSYNSTGLDTVKTAWTRDLCKLTKTDFLNIQEHFMKNKLVDKYFKDQFPDFSPYVIPAYREQTQDSGRPKGGIAQLSRKTFKIEHERIVTTNFRVQAQVLHFPNTRVLWINSYLPNDPQTIRYNDEELVVVLNAIEKILDTANFDDVIWTGDLNWDMERNTGFSDTMKRFMDRLSLHSVWERHPVSYTHIHTDLKSTSTLDHFIVNERLLSVISDCGVLHLGDNLSRHSPIMLKLDLGSLPKCHRVKSSPSVRRPAWYKATQEDKNLYTQELGRRLSLLEVPEYLDCSNPCCTELDHSQQRDNFVIDLMSTVIETSHATIPMTGGKPGRHSSSKSCPIEGNIPGWADHVKPYKDDAVFWNSIWQSSGRPSQGSIRDKMAKSRNQYHYAVRRVKKMSNSIRARKLL